MNTQGLRDHKIEPEHLGPLADRPLAETAKSGGPGDLFPGASAFLSARQQTRRREQWNVARTMARRLLKPEEHILYVAHGMEVAPVLHMMAMGALAMAYHQVVLVFTDTRLIEVMLDMRGKKAGTRLRSYPWSGVKDLKFSFKTLKMMPAQGRKQAWKVPVGGDRKLLKALIPRLKPHLLKEGAARAERLPLWHCPQCGGTVEAHPKACRSCRASFSSPGLATILSLAFPGGGLFYAGHPFLGTMDLLGETFLYAIFLTMMLQTGPEAIGAVLGFGVLLFVLTKFESIHLSRILISRSKPETEARRAGFKKFAMAGGMASLLLIGGALPLAGKARPRLDRDLEVAGERSTWAGSRDASQWGVFSDDADARSQWRHPSGLKVTLFAYPGGAFDNTREFRSEFRSTLQKQGMELVKDDEEVPSPFHGFRFVGLSKNSQGETVSVIHYFVMDEENSDLHQVVAAVMEEDGEFAEGLVGDLLSHSQWIAATPPTRPAPVEAPAPAGS
jgi:hypothetical protein